MRLGFVVNEVADEQAVYTTTRLAMGAVNRGHEAWLLGGGAILSISPMVPSVPRREP